MDPPRPAVSVVVPFYGDADHARQIVAALHRLRLREGDEILLADNTPEGIAADAASGRVVHVTAGQVQSSYFARNAGAERARNDWLLFLDSDCVPSTDLLDAYFGEPVGKHVGAIAGEVVGDETQRSLAARYSRSRRHIGQAEIQDHPYRPMAVTANLLVRRRAWHEIGGFHEGIRSGGDADFSWRLQDAGWELGYRALAEVEHRHRETLRDLLRQSARYGAGMRWLTRRHRGATFGGWARPLARCFAAAPVLLVTARPRRALFKVLDAAWIAANAVGTLASNVHQASLDTAEVVIVASSATGASVAEARRAIAEGATVRVEARRRAEHPRLGSASQVPTTYAEDDGPARRFGDFLVLALTRPVATVSTLRGGTGERSLFELAPTARRIRRAGSRQLRACGSAAAGDAATLARLTGVPWSMSEPSAPLPAASRTAC